MHNFKYFLCGFLVVFELNEIIVTLDDWASAINKFLHFHAFTTFLWFYNVLDFFRSIFLSNWLRKKSPMLVSVTIGRYRIGTCQSVSVLADSANYDANPSFLVMQFNLTQLIRMNPEDLEKF